MKILKYIIIGLTLVSTTTLGQQGQILHEGCICLDSASVDQSLNWYALIKTERKFYFALKPVKIVLNTKNDCELSPLEIRTNTNSKSHFLIGTNHKWEEREIYAPYNWDNSSGVDITKTDMDIYSINLKDDKKSSSNRLYKFGNNGFGGFAIIGRTRSGKEIAQELHESFDVDMLERNGLFLKWFGDLDGDNKADLILHVMTDWERGSFNYLFLSTEARSDEVIRKVADTNIGHCN
jgi:hypothetical protein